MGVPVVVFDESLDAEATLMDPSMYEKADDATGGQVAQMHVY
jgi:hypothetical protein